MIKHVLFDAANTLIHKPKVWDSWLDVLSKHGMRMDHAELTKVHKLTSESITFPDRTGKEFYETFNSKVLFNLGIVPTPEMLNDLFLAMHRLNWEVFADTDALNSISLPMSIASNFSTDLSEKISSMFSVKFNQMVISEDVGFRKPFAEFYECVIDRIGLDPQEILYIGDSLELDVMPAQNCSMRAYLIDRDGIYPRFTDRIESLHKLPNLLSAGLAMQ